MLAKGKETNGGGAPRETVDGCLGPRKLGVGQEGPVLAGCCQGSDYQKD